MKKANRILAILLALVMCLGLLAACTDPNGPSDESSPSGSNSATEPGDAQVKITDGIFVHAGDPTHRMIIKFKEDGTFYAQGLTQQKAYIGVYEVVDMEMEYIGVGPDDVWNNREEGCDDDSDVSKSTKAVKFFEADGETPFNLRFEISGLEMNAGVPLNILAYTDGVLHQAVIDGYDRSLRQDATAEFTVDDEIKNLLYSFMPETLPDWAATEGYELADLKLELYHNSWEDLATALELQSGSYSKIEGNVYTLDNGAVITVAEDGKTATYVKDGNTMNMVPWTDIPISAKLEGVITVQLETVAMDMDASVVLYTDGTAVFAAGNAQEQFTYRYDGETFTVGGEMFTLESFTYENDQLTLTMTGTMDGRAFTMTVSGTVEEDLNGNATVSELLTTGEASLVDGAVKMHTVFLSDGTCKVMANGDTVVAQARWYLDASKQLKFTNVSNGALAASDNATVIWVGIANPKLPELTAEMAVDAEDLAKLEAAEPTVLFTAAEAPLMNGAIVVKADFYTDGTLKLIANGSTEVATAAWSFSQADSGLPIIEITDVSSGTMSFALSEDYKSGIFTWTGILNPQIPEQTVEMINTLPDLLPLKWA